MEKVHAALSSFLILCLVCVSLAAIGCGDSENRTEVSITGPLDGATFDEFNPVTFAGKAIGKNNLPLPDESLRWNSNLDGDFGTGTSVTAEYLSPGVHTITLTAMDDEGNIGSDSISIKVNLATGLIPRGNSYSTYYGDWSFEDADFLWASATVRDENGNAITGLNVDDFTITESIVSATGERITVPHEVHINLQKEHDWEPQWFWEESLGKEQLDVVFLVETRGTMEDAMPGIRSQIHQFVNRLLESNIDFRLAGVALEETPNWDFFEFHGPGEVDRLNEDIDELFTTGGTWWNPVDSYDPLIWTPWLGFREESRKVCVIIADILPQTVYDSFWYSGGCTTATRSAVELFLQNHPDMELYYCLNPARPVDIEQYINPDINPMAGNALDQNGLGSGFAALESGGFATSIPWPFDERAIPLDPVQPVDHLYYFVWENAFSWEDWDKVSENPADYRVEVLMEVSLPGTDKTYSATFNYPIIKEAADIHLNFVDEKENDINHLAGASLDYMVGDRAYPYIAQIDLTAGPVRVAVGTYHLKIEASGGTDYFLGNEIEGLRFLGRRTITVPPEGLTLNLRVATADREAQLLKARGLLKDLRDNWRQPGNPFNGFVVEAEDWLDEVDRNGIDWAEMVRLKRFTVALSGYANLVEYGQQEIEKAIRNLQEIIADFQNILDKVIATEATLESDLEEKLSSMAMEVALDILTAGGFSALKETVERGLQELLEYAGGELLDDLKDMVCAELVHKDYREILCTLIDVAADLPGATEDEDWSAITDSLAALSLDIALEHVTDLIADDFMESLFNSVDLDDEVGKTIFVYIKDVLTTLTSESGPDRLGGALEEFAAGIIGTFGEKQYAEKRSDIIEAIRRIFAKLHDAVADALGSSDEASLVSGFLIGMTEDMVLAALPSADADGHIDDGPDAMSLGNVLIKHALFQLFLKEYFVDEVAEGLRQILKSAKAFVPQGDDPERWEASLSDDFGAYWSEMESLQQTAWNALETQEDIERWAEGLQGLVTILEPIRVALEALAAMYPPMEDTAEAVDNFITVLDGIQILPKAIEFALRIDSLDTFGDKAEPLYLMAFGQGEE